jgi:protein-S-isoprenylcysteine O-methyltransferase Ste14
VPPLTPRGSPTGGQPAASNRAWPWVTAQLGLALLLFWPLREWPRSWTGLLPGYLPIAGGAALMAWTLNHNRRGNWQVAPALRSGARLVRTGPYRWVRHPMYVAVLVLGLGFVALDRHLLDALVWLALAALFAVKARLEERALTETFPDYADYRRHTGAFWPRLHG